MAGGNILALAVHIRLTQHRLGAVFFLLALQLLGNDLCRLIPGNADVFALAAGFGVTVAVGIPVHSLQGVFHSVGGIHPGLIAQTEGRNGHPIRCRKRAAPGFDFPGVAVFVRILLIVVIRTNPRDLAIIGVHQTGAAAFRAHKAEADDVLILGNEFILHRQELLLPCYSFRLS